MTLNELINRLTDIQDEYGDIDVRAAFQPNYPLITELQAITTVVGNEKTEPTVYLAIGDGDEYGSKQLWDDDYVSLDDEDDDQ